MELERDCDEVCDWLAEPDIDCVKLGVKETVIDWLCEEDTVCDDVVDWLGVNVSLAVIVFEDVLVTLGDAEELGVGIPLEVRDFVIV